MPDHPVTRGVKPFKINDEWYFHMRFVDGMKGVTPLFAAIPPASTMSRKDGPHEGNPEVRKAVAEGKPQEMAWAFDRADGVGRGFGFTGAHYHKNWGEPNFRRLVVNAILWTAHVDIPAGGAKCDLDPADLEQEPRQERQIMSARIGYSYWNQRLGLGSALHRQLAWGARESQGDGFRHGRVSAGAGVVSFREESQRGAERRRA